MLSTDSSISWVPSTRGRRTPPNREVATDPVGQPNDVDQRPTPTRVRQRSAQIDVLKGLAIIGVMAQHAFSARTLNSGWDILYIGQAVPIFFVVMGLNAGRSLARARGPALQSLYSIRYAIGRVNRIVRPFLVIWPVALIAAIAAGQAHVGPTVLVGALPMSSAPGNYFVTVLFEFAIVFPVLFWCFSSAPAVTTFALVAADIAFELAAPHVRAFSQGGFGRYVYDAALIKYVVVLLAGLWLGRLGAKRRYLLWMTPLAAFSLGYLILLHQSPGSFGWLVPSYSRATNFLSAFYAIWLVLLGLEFLPSIASSAWSRMVAAMGRGSYHIFLVQIIWFGLAADYSWVGSLVGIATCTTLGYAFFVADPHVMAWARAHGGKQRNPAEG